MYREFERIEKKKVRTGLKLEIDLKVSVALAISRHSIRIVLTGYVISLP